MGVSKNSNFYSKARKHRTETRSVDGLHEELSTELTPLSDKKAIFRGAHMAEVVLCNQLIPAIDIPKQCGVETNQLHGPGCISPDKLMPHTPYIVKSKTSSEALNSGIINQLSSAPAVKELTQLSHT